MDEVSPRLFVIQCFSSYLDANVAETAVFVAEIWFELVEVVSSRSDTQTIAFVEFKHGPEREKVAQLLLLPI